MANQLIDPEVILTLLASDIGAMTGDRGISATHLPRLLRIIGEALNVHGNNYEGVKEYVRYCVALGFADGTSPHREDETQ